MSTGTLNVRYATDFHLEQLTLITPLTNGIIDLMPLMLEISLFEDIYSSTISGEVIVRDALGLTSNFRINGTEYVQIVLKKTADDPYPISKNYRVVKIKNRSTGDNNAFETYSISFCSEEFVVSEQYRISQSYPGKPISNIVIDILNNWLGVGKGNTKKINVEATSGVYDFILPNKKIFETINWLATYAMPASKKPGADMIFFENSVGYWFSSLQTLYSQEAATTYWFDPKNISKEISQQVTNALNFEVLNYFDTLGAVSNGTFSNRVLSIDPLQRSFRVTDFNYNDYAAKSSKMNEYPLTNNFKDRMGKAIYNPPSYDLEAGALRLVSSNSEQKKNTYIAQNLDVVANDIFIEKYLPHRVAQLGLANYMRIKITVPGDPQIMAGKTVNFGTYAPGGEGLERTLDPFYSGKYLVSAVRHIVKNNSYITVMELCKESVSDSFAGFDNNNGLLNSLVNGEQI
jgi:hypothetical protein